MKRGKELGVDIYSSYYLPYLNRKAYCSANGHLLNVTPEGILSTCHRVNYHEDRGADYFVVGKYDVDLSSLLINEKQIEMMDTKVDIPIVCINCIALYNCYGGCYAQNATSCGDVIIPDPYRCSITQKLFKHYLYKAVENTKK